MLVNKFSEKIVQNICVIAYILKGVIWCDFKFSFLFGVLQADCA